MVASSGEVRAHGVPLVVSVLCIANAAAFVYEVHLSSGPLTDGGAMGEFVARFGLIPREFLREVAQPGTTAQVVWLTPLTAMFLHGGILHVAGNLLYLWLFGRPIELALGPLRFLALYLAGGLAASGALVASDPSGYVATVGASGAISGVLGAYLVANPRERVRLPGTGVGIPVAAFLVLWIAIQLLSGVGGVGSWSGEGGRVAWWAHAGGFAAGIALGAIFPPVRPADSHLRI